MNKLFELGITEENLKFILECNPNILDMQDNEIEDKVNILKYIGCDRKQIKHIISSNPEYLDSSNQDLIKLIIYLKNNKLNNLDLLFDTNPYFLNYDIFEIEEYINKQISRNRSFEDIVKEIENNPYIMEQE